MIAALFESYATDSEEFYDKRKVSYQGSTIIITDLSAVEMRVLNSLLQSFLDIKPSYSLGPISHRFNFSGPQSTGDHRRKNSLLTLCDDSDASAEECNELEY